MSEQIIVIGGGGHAKVVIDSIRSVGDEVIGILDDNLSVGEHVLNVPILGKIEDYKQFDKYKFVIGIGDNTLRKLISERIGNQVSWHTVIHRSAVVSDYSSVGAGSVIFANAVINANATLGMHCIINSGAIVEHDNVLGDFVHVSPAASLGGVVTVGENTHIGIGATVRNALHICGDCIIGAGAVVVKDITEKGTYVGVPARKM